MLIGIIQDDEDDWNRAVSTLANIYENAHLTIAATASPDSSGGCFSDPNSTFRAQKLKNSSLHVAEWHPTDMDIQRGLIRNLDRWPLMTRAWVFQERTVSPRIVHFTDTQLLWECCSMMKSESGDIDHDWTYGDLGYSTNAKSPFKYPAPDTTTTWHDTVRDYSSLELTFSKDRLPALAAIVQRMLRMRKNDTYIAGLWKSSLLRDLTWRRRGPGSSSRSVSRVPSWSWASITGAVIHASHRDLAWARSLDVSYDLGEFSEPDHLDGAAVLLECYSCAGYISWFGYTSPPCFIFSGEDLGMPAPGNVWRIMTDYDWRTGSEPVPDGEVAVVAVIEWGGLNSGMQRTNWGGIVLRQVSQATYKRIGWCYLDSNEPFSSVSRKAKLRDNFAWRYYRQFVASLPVRSFRIV